MAIYKDFNIQPENSLVSGDVVTNVKDTVSSGMWADGDGSMTTFFMCACVCVFYHVFHTLLTARCALSEVCWRMSA